MPTGRHTRTVDESTEHTRSYYAATANWPTAYPRLEGQITADVCIIGGGFTGVAVALNLVERGYSVALLEARRISWGASGRNGGQLIGGVADHRKIEKKLGPEAGEMVWRLGLETTELVRKRIEQFGIDCDLKDGYFDAALNARQMDALLDWKEDREARNYPYPLKVIGKDDLSTVVGSELYVGGVIDGANGHLHPLNLCIGEAKAAADLGVSIFEQSPVTRILPGATASVHTGHGMVKAGYVVLACNAYLGGLAPTLTGRVLPAGSYIIATEPLAEQVAREILPRDMAVCDQNVVLDYYRLSADRRLLFGGRCNYSGRHPRSISGTLRPRMLKVFPQLGKPRIDYEWGGNIAITINRIPQLGRLDANTYYAMGYSGHGVAPSHTAGLVLAEAIAGDAEKLDVFERIKHLRLPGGKWFASPAFALGMLYYRIRDALQI